MRKSITRIKVMATYEKRFSDHQKRKLLEEFYASNYTNSAFCRINGIKESTFRYWRGSAHLNRGIEDKRFSKGEKLEDPLLAESEEIASLVKVGADNTDTANAVIDIPKEALTPNREVQQYSYCIKDTSRISSPIHLSLGMIHIDLDDGCSTLELKNIITVLNGVV